MLEGTRVLAVDVYLAGPIAARMLADLGAEVVKIENVDGGDPYRHQKHDYDEGTPKDLTYRFPLYNRGKRSLPLNLADERGQEIFEDLAADADVILENLKPGAMETFGLGYEDIRERNDEIVYCSISGFGQTGPYKDRSAVDTIIQAMSGLVSQNAADAGSPALTGIYIADVIGGMYATISILSALASDTRDGTHIDVSMLDGLVSLLNHEAAEYSARGTAPPRIKSALVPTGVFETADGAIAMNVPDRSRQPFYELLGIDDWAASTEFEGALSRPENARRIKERVQEALRAEPTDHWLERLLDAGVMAAPVNSVDEAFEDESIRSRQLVRERSDGALGDYIDLDFPSKFSNYETSPTDPPRFGEDVGDILRELGYSRAEIRALFEDGVVSDYEH